MKTKNLLPVLLLIVMALAALFLRRCQSPETKEKQVSSSEVSKRSSPPRPAQKNTNENNGRFNRNVSELYFTKHAKCRMACRHITQKEVKEILAEGTINYNKSELDDPKGPTYALEGETSDRQHVRIIFAPKQKHMSVVTVIDLENDFECNCN